jgi:flavin reductase (DIM6/NTAB) family NADH-FMN oxidoreductase RutF
LDLNWGSVEASKFVTSVGLITSNGSFGNNIMACEWTNHISYSPGLIAIHITKRKATYENIVESKEFGVNICSFDSFIMSSISGGYSGRNYDKIKALEELGFGFFKAKKINALMVKDAVLNAECKLVKEIELGDHIMLVGEVVNTITDSANSLVYHNGKYWVLEKNPERLSEEQRNINRKVIEKYRKN